MEEVSHVKFRFTTMITWYFLTFLIGCIFAGATEKAHHRSLRYAGLPNSPIFHINSFTGTNFFRPSLSRPSSLTSPFRRLSTQFLSNGRPGGFVTKLSSNLLSSVTVPKKKWLTLSKLINLPLNFISNAKPYKLLIHKPNLIKLG
ncbi:uncharacterized protein LOC106458370 [Limulus polyphemus]|uniref:Uncharacterized protein LOC106458370 n=1 Tax=Limulus polyphemus TaxID=6850 RepID=A0ABM1B2A0_LIMPO|nr:uncharacterized protein LOC106458370 [Limulus polyphemus]